MKFKFDVNFFVPAILFFAVLLSYAGGGETPHYKLYSSILIPILLYVLSYKYIEIDLIFILIFLNFLLGLLFIPFYGVYNISDLLHGASYFLLISGAYFTSINLYKNFSITFIYYIVIGYFFILLLHHLFVYLNIGEGRFFWNIEFRSQRSISTGTFSNLGNGKNITAFITSLTMISIPFLNLRNTFKLPIALIVFGAGLLSFSRAFIFISLLGYAYYLYFLVHTGKIKLSIYYLIIPVIILMVIISNLEMFVFLFLREDFTQIGEVGRVQQFMAYIDIIRDYPILGTGWSQFTSVVGRYLPFGQTELGGIILLVEQGLIRGGILVLFIVTSSISLIFIDFSKLSTNKFSLLCVSFGTLIIGIVWGNNIVADAKSYFFWLAVFMNINFFRYTQGINYNFSVKRSGEVL
ncbi:hypothetical protein AB2B38_008780 [Balneola sp. MJW-20]|uniref:hypothetical protein n=1 Tax=Gracilimonas aurantiaca TaxID=3234185 RepID=UPI00346659DC